MLHLRNHTSKKDPVISGTFFENIFFTIFGIEETIISSLIFCKYYSSK
jgi:hypothetical protein